MFVSIMYGHFMFFTSFWQLAMFLFAQSASSWGPSDSVTFCFCDIRAAGSSYTRPKLKVRVVFLSKRFRVFPLSKTFSVIVLFSKLHVPAIVC